jgi:omega-amidase
MRTRCRNTLKISQPESLKNSNEMNDELLVSLVQNDIMWESTDYNLSKYSDLIAPLKNKTDLIVLPEMFTTGFSMNTGMLAESPGGRTMQWMARKAEELQCVLTGSIIISQGGSYYNSLIWMRPDGSFSRYDKKHLFRLGREDLFYSPGKDRLVTEIRGWNILPVICYDLRFPVWTRNHYTGLRYEYDVMICVANWPAVRQRVWSVLLSARAIENQAFVIGVNRTGTDGNGIYHSGNSMVAGPAGDILAECDKDKIMIRSVRLSVSDLKGERDRLQAGEDWDQFEIITG